jgi:glutaminase
MNITPRYTVTPTGLQPAVDGEVVLWADHQEKVAWLLRLKGYVQQKVDATYRSYLRVCAETGWRP